MCGDKRSGLTQPQEPPPLAKSATTKPCACCTNPDLSQRALARALGVSVGSANFCVRALVEKGWIKIQNFRTSKDKRAYAYLLTPHGIEQKAQITRHFLKR